MDLKARLAPHLFLRLRDDCVALSFIYSFIYSFYCSWCHIYHQSRLAGVVVIVLHEMSQLHFYKFYLQFKHLRKVFQHVSPRTVVVY